MAYVCYTAVVRRRTMVLLWCNALRSNPSNTIVRDVTDRAEGNGEAHAHFGDRAARP